MSTAPQRKTVTVFHNFGPGHSFEDVTLDVLSTVYDPSMARYYCLVQRPESYETFIVSYPPKSEEYYIIQQGPRNDMLNEFLRIVIEAHAFDPIGFPWVVK